MEFVIFMSFVENVSFINVFVCILCFYGFVDNWKSVLEYVFNTSTKENNFLQKDR